MSTTPQDDRPDGELERSEAYRTFVAGSRARFGDDADAWLDALPALLRDVRDRWSLQLEQPASSDGTRLRVDVARAGEPASLEVTYPDGWWAETTHALASWNGDAALRLLEHDPRGARLLERPEPGTALRAEPDERVSLREATHVCDRLWIPDPGGITPVATEVRAWASTLEARHIRVGRPFERELVRSAEELIVDVDGGRKRVRLRFEVLTERLRCNPGRVRGWAFATSIDQAVWCCEQ